MRPIPLDIHPAKGLGLELDAEQLAALEKIRSGWSEVERQNRIAGAAISEMSETFRKHEILLEKARIRNLNRNRRRNAK